MYIIIYIINYNEYIVIYNIESHSLTITSTTWLNNVPHWYTNCKCTDKKALDEVNEVAYAQRAINSLFIFFTFFLNPHIYILISWTTLDSLFDFSWAYLYIYIYLCIYVYTSTYILRLDTHVPHTHKCVRFAPRDATRTWRLMIRLNRCVI